ncbi:MAG TPA: 2-polyprenyl-3-methyl-6-methoxy-1,4-benzoquinone monooxygenase [Gammaproteobacteria bacterium]|nr:2-polyprenyl-3-methyl-6-methoxy-1,4-benzoquinone monooxygenase [Gammaproteobacteria bacterium]
MSTRGTTPADRLLAAADRALRTVYGIPIGTGRPNPARAKPGARGGDAPLRTRTGRLMRVNLAGEVAAQALYQGQSLTARSAAVAARMRRAAQEENDHLLWCRERLADLGAHPSRLNPLWYAGSLLIGAVAGAAGDARSLGFLEETERQVVAHLGRHLQRLAPGDEASRALLGQMRRDEARHGLHARTAGAKRPPPAIRLAMRLASRVMTGAAYWI